MLGLTTDKIHYEFDKQALREAKYERKKGEKLYKDEATGASVCMLVGKGKKTTNDTAVVHQRLTQPLPQMRSELEKGLREVCSGLSAVANSREAINSGASGIIATLQQNRLGLAYVGQCAAILILRAGEEIRVDVLSVDHVPSNWNETARLAAEAKAKAEREQKAAAEAKVKAGEVGPGESRYERKKREGKEAKEKSAAQGEIPVADVATGPDGAASAVATAGGTAVTVGDAVPVGTGAVVAASAEASAKASTEAKTTLKQTRAFGNSANHSRGVSETPSIRIVDLNMASGCETLLLLVPGGVTKAFQKPSKLERFLTQYRNFSLPELAERISLEALCSEQNVAALIVPLGKDPSIYAMFAGFGGRGARIADALAQNTLAQLHQKMPAKEEDISAIQRMEEEEFATMETHYFTERTQSFISYKIKQTAVTAEAKEQEDAIRKAFYENHDLVLEPVFDRRSAKKIAGLVFYRRITIFNVCKAECIEGNATLRPLFKAKLEIIVDDILPDLKGKAYAHLILDANGTAMFAKIIAAAPDEILRFGPVYSIDNEKDDISGTMLQLDEKRNRSVRLKGKVIPFKPSNSCLSPERIFELNAILKNNLVLEKLTEDPEHWLDRNWNYNKAIFYHLFSFYFEYNGIFAEANSAAARELDAAIKSYLDLCFTPDFPPELRLIEVRKTRAFVQANFEEKSENYQEICALTNGSERFDKTVDLLFLEEVYLALSAPYLPVNKLLPTVFPNKTLATKKNIGIGAAVFGGVAGLPPAFAAIKSAEVATIAAYASCTVSGAAATLTALFCCQAARAKRREREAKARRLLSYPETKDVSADALAPRQSSMLTQSPLFHSGSVALTIRHSPPSAPAQAPAVVSALSLDEVAELPDTRSPTPSVSHALQLILPLPAHDSASEEKSLLAEYANLQQITEQRKKAILENRQLRAKLYSEIKEVFGDSYIPGPDTTPDINFLFLIADTTFNEFLQSDKSRMDGFCRLLRSTQNPDDALRVFSEWDPSFDPSWLSQPGMVTSEATSVTIPSGAQLAHMPR